MSLKIHNDGYVEIKSKKDAAEALKRFRDLKIEIDEVKADSGLVELERDAMAYKAGLQRFMVDREIEQVQGKGFHGTLIQGTRSKRWIATEEDLTGDEPDGATSLQSIIEEKFGASIKVKGPARRLWRKITKAVVDAEALEEAVAEDLLTSEEIAPAFVELPSTPYLRVFEETEEDG